MPNKQRKFADDGWAVWIDGDDVSTIYINDWLNPKGKSYVDFAIRIRGVMASKLLSVYVPFEVKKEEIEDVSLLFNDTNILQATFSSSCIIEYKKNECTSEIAYNGKVVDIVHIGELGYETSVLSEGTLIKIDLEKLRPYLDNDEAYFIWRMPHKSLDEVFAPRKDMNRAMERLKDLITTPIVAEKFGYSIRINEARLLPEEITKIGAFHRQKLKKAVVTLSVNESYELNDASAYRIRRLEENLYKDFLPKGYKSEDVITYQWQQNRETNLKGNFNFYYNVNKNSVSRGSMFLYLVLLTVIGVIGNLIADVISKFIGL
ncbi:MAG: hypothetical protein E7373_02090 [Clostridiales bacterium]|nr:hypothetical protein [Clostridiales bacterium]